MRQIAGLAAADRPSLMPLDAASSGTEPPPSPADLDFVERLLWLSHVDPFRRASLESVAELTRRQTVEVPIRRGKR